ncbi:MAG TPA: hypothetical protein VJX74_03060 [Blastocatellia bacterium]|nr:hypothetical protein [Blastocatellia bacterium]
MSMIDTMNWLKDPEAKVVEQIISAFPITPPPRDENLVCAGIEHLQKCDECRNAQQFFKGKTREIILGDERNYPHLVNAFDFFTPETWHYYLPVFLIQDLIRQRHSYNHFWHHNEPGLIDGHWSKRIELMDMPQCEALIGYLEFHKSFTIESRDIEKLSKILEWWEGIYQEKVAIK